MSNEVKNNNGPEIDQKSSVFKITLAIGLLIAIAIGIVVNAHILVGDGADVTDRTEVSFIETIAETEPIETSEPVYEAPSAPVIEETIPEVDQHDLEMLACVIYQEAGADYVCDDCRRRVADVVLNRVESEYFPDTIEGVLTAPRQYGRFHWTGVVWPERASDETEAEAVARAYRIAEEVLIGKHSDLYGEGYIWQAEFKQGKEQIYCCGTYFGR